MIIFTPNTLIRSNEVNGNFDEINTRLTNLESFSDSAATNYVASGCVWTGDSYGSSRNASMTAGVVYINYTKVNVSAVSSRTFTASKDTYIDVDINGTLTYSEVTNNTASPTLASGSIRLAIVCTGASNIANKYSINQGSIANTTNEIYLPRGLSGWNGNPSCSVIVDSLGNRICNRDPEGRLVTAFSRAAVSTTGAPGGTSVAWNGMNYVLFLAEANTNYKLTFQEGAISGQTGSGEMIFEFYLATNYNTYTTRAGDHDTYIPASANSPFATIMFNSGTYSGLTYLNIKIRSAGWSGTMTINSDAVRTGNYIIEKIS